MANYIIDPVGRMEGHLGIEFDSDVIITEGEPLNPSGVVHPGPLAPLTDPKAAGTMYRGFENIMLDRQPQEGIQICQRI